LEGFQGVEKVDSWNIMKRSSSTLIHFGTFTFVPTLFRFIKVSHRLNFEYSNRESSGPDGSVAAQIELEGLSAAGTDAGADADGQRPCAQQA
jgi:hypothetical protein